MEDDIGEAEMKAVMAAEAEFEQKKKKSAASPEIGSINGGSNSSTAATVVAGANGRKRTRAPSRKAKVAAIPEDSYSEGEDEDDEYEPEAPVKPTAKKKTNATDDASSGGGGSGTKSKAKPKKKSTGSVKAKLDASQASSLIVSYMKSSVRPFNTTKVFENLNKEISHPVVKTLMAELTNKGIISSKEEGKNVVFWIVQNQEDGAQKEMREKNLENLKIAVESLKRKTESEAAELSVQQTNVAALAKEPTDEILSSEIVNCRGLISNLAQQKKELVESFSKFEVPVDAPSKEAVECAISFYNNARKELLRTVESTLSQISEGTGQNVKDLKEEIGIES